MTSTEPAQLVKRINENTKKSPLKVVSPIIKKYTGHRQGKIKNKLKFPRVFHGGRSKQKKQIKPQLKTILPKTNAGNVIILEPELLPCALNLLKRKRKDDDTEISNDSELVCDSDGKQTDHSQPRENGCKISRPKLISNNKKKIKCLKNLELLESDTSAFKEKREQAFAENYLLRVQQRLMEKNEAQYKQFVDLICNFQMNGLTVCDLYRKVKCLFASHTDLIEDFVAFLTPEQAVECGVFMDHLLLTTMSDFLNMIDIYFAKSPHQIKKIHSTLESLAAKSNINTEIVINSVMPLLKGNPVLKDYFAHLLPNVRPPDNFCMDFEKIEYPELNSDVSDDEEVMETIHLPEVEDLYGGELCPCNCHKKKSKIQGQHCISCSLKFINGKIFIQNGKLLRSAKVVFDDYDMNYHRERLAPKLYPKRGKKKHRLTVFKDNLSPTKSCNLSSDEFKSDVEEEEKAKMKFLNSKSPKSSRKKSVSPKHNDKCLSKCLLNESRVEHFNFEEKFSGSNKCLYTSGIINEEKPFNVVTIDFEMPTSNDKNDLPVLIKSPYESDLEPKESESPSESLVLAKTNSENSLDNTSQVLKLPSINVQNDIDADNSSVLTSKEDRSSSPPVISIPETSNPPFINPKPILHLLENLEDTKDFRQSTDNDSNKVFKFEQSLNTSEELSTKEFKNEEVKKEEKTLPWKIDEDRVILQTLQVEENCEETFLKIGEIIPARSVDDIKKRFAELMNILYEMKARTGNG